jgi:hypothetical protein
VRDAALAHANKQAERQAQKNLKEAA